MEVEPIPEQVQEKNEQVDSADLVVGVIAELDQEGLVMVCDALRTLSGSPRIAILQDDHAANPAVTNPETADKNASPYLVPWPLLRPDTPGMSVVSMSAAYQSVFAAGEKLGAQACCVIASRLETAAPGWACHFAASTVCATNLPDCAGA